MTYRKINKKKLEESLRNAGLLTETNRPLIELLERIYNLDAFCAHLSKHIKDNGVYIKGERGSKLNGAVSTLATSQKELMNALVELSNLYESSI